MINYYCCQNSSLGENSDRTFQQEVFIHVHLRLISPVPCPLSPVTCHLSPITDFSACVIFENQLGQEFDSDYAIVPPSPCKSACLLAIILCRQWGRQ